MALAAPSTVIKIPTAVEAVSSFSAFVAELRVAAPADLNLVLAFIGPPMSDKLGNCRKFIAVDPVHPTTILSTLA